MEHILILDQIEKSFGEQKVIKPISIELERGKFYTLLGPSGCGKTTLLNIIAGFVKPDNGSIYYDGKDITAKTPNSREVNTVFQNYALFPHMNVYDNVAFGLKLKKLNKQAIREKVEEVLTLVNLKDYQNSDINDLSGGQKQRVAIARAIINEPKVLLLDEPLSALDLKLRTEMQYELKAIQKRLGITFVFITHDQEEALAMSDYIYVMKDGVVEQSGTPTDIYDEPVNRFVADFIGESNIIEGTMIDDGIVQMYNKRFECVDGGFEPMANVEVVLRPEDIEVTDELEGLLDVTIKSSLFKGVHYELIGVDNEGYEWLIQTTKKRLARDKVGLKFNPEDIHIMLPGETEDEFDARLMRYQDVLNDE